MNNERLNSIIRTMILPAVLGLSAGIVGGLLAYPYYLEGTVETTPTAVNRPTFAQTAPLPETELANRLKRLNVQIFPKRLVKTGELADRALLPSDASGFATVLTSDGWLLAHQNTVKGGIVVSIGNRLLEPRTSIADAATGLVFLKVDAEPLQVGGFEETDVMREGVPLFVNDSGRHFARTVFAGVTPIPRKDRPATLRSSDRFSRSFLLGVTLDAKSYGGAVLTSSGNIAGVVVPPLTDSGFSEFIPMHLLRPVLTDAFRNQTPVRPALGLNYVDLESVSAVESGISNRGEAVAGSKKFGIPAVLPGSAASAAGILEGDILLRLDNVELSGGRDLAEVVAEYKPGAKVKIEGVRNGEAKSFDVTLTEALK